MPKAVRGRPPKPPEELVSRFIEAWNRGVPYDGLRRMLKVDTAWRVRLFASSLRRRGHKLKPRIWGRKDGAMALKPVEGDVLDRIEVPPATIYDGAGRPVAIMDPVTRKRKRL